MYMAPHHPPPTHLIVLPNTGGPKRSFFGPNFCLRSEFEGIFKKSQIFFRFRGDFRKKVCIKRVKKGVKTGFSGFWAYFTLFYPISPLLPYFGPHLGCGD